MIGQKHRVCKVMSKAKVPAPHAGPAGRPAGPLACLLAVFCLLAAMVAPVLAQDNPSGLPLPRFATTRSTPINVRVGPGTRYDISWIYVKEGVPVEIIQEFDTWRRIRDVDGSEGWVHQNLLSGDRAAYIAPWDATIEVPLLPDRNEEASARAILASGFRVDLSECDGSWCEVSATHRPEGERAATYHGYVRQDQLWGVYRTEVFD